MLHSTGILLKNEARLWLGTIVPESLDTPAMPFWLFVRITYRDWWVTLIEFPNWNMHYRIWNKALTLDLWLFKYPWGRNRPHDLYLRSGERIYLRSQWVWLLNNIAAIYVHCLLLSNLIEFQVIFTCGTFYWAFFNFKFRSYIIVD